MTARDMRELLRDAANNLYAMADYGGNKNHCAEMEMQSRALKALADRFDAEEESQRWLWDVNDKAADKPGCHTQLACLALLARLNASPLTPPGEPTCKTCGGSKLVVFRDGPWTDSKPCPDCAPDPEVPRCGTCDGRGYVMKLNDGTKDGPLKWRETCPACNGTGGGPLGKGER